MIQLEKILSRSELAILENAEREFSLLARERLRYRRGHPSYRPSNQALLKFTRTRGVAVALTVLERLATHFENSPDALAIRSRISRLQQPKLFPLVRAESPASFLAPWAELKI